MTHDWNSVCVWGGKLEVYWPYHHVYFIDSVATTLEIGSTEADCMQRTCLFWLKVLPMNCVSYCSAIFKKFLLPFLRARNEIRCKKFQHDMKRTILASCTFFSKMEEKMCYGTVCLWLAHRSTYKLQSWVKSRRCNLYYIFSGQIYVKLF